LLYNSIDWLYQVSTIEKKAMALKPFLFLIIKHFFLFFSFSNMGRGKGELQHDKTQNGWATQTTTPNQPKNKVTQTVYNDGFGIQASIVTWIQVTTRVWWKRNARFLKFIF
jgi:hypothetical protein